MRDHERPQGKPTMAEQPTRDDMLKALRADVLAWPQRVRDAGVKKSDGTAYVPLPRNNAILRTPDDPEATYSYMVRTWEADDGDQGSDGWYRIIKDAGPKLTWEYFMVDEEAPYAPLFSPELRERVKNALDRDAGTAEWLRRKDQASRSERERAERIAKLREEWRSGKAKRPPLPDLDQGLS
jgi:hypothetical protein